MFNIFSLLFWYNPAVLYLMLSMQLKRRIQFHDAAGISRSQHRQHMSEAHHGGTESACLLAMHRAKEETLGSFQRHRSSCTTHDPHMSPDPKTSPIEASKAQGKSRNKRTPYSSSWPLAFHTHLSIEFPSTVNAVQLTVLADHPLQSTVIMFTKTPWYRAVLERCVETCVETAGKLALQNH